MNGNREDKFVGGTKNGIRFHACFVRQQYFLASDGLRMNSSSIFRLQEILNKTEVWEYLVALIVFSTE